MNKEILMTKKNARNNAGNEAQHGRLCLSRYIGQSIFVYPSADGRNASAADLFADPLRIVVERIEPEPESVALRVIADTRLVVVRDEIYKQHKTSFRPNESLRTDAHKRAFFDIAREILPDARFDQLSEAAWRRVMLDVK